MTTYRPATTEEVNDATEDHGLAELRWVVRVDGPVYRKVPSNATDADHVCGDEECYRLVEVGEEQE